MCRNRRGGGVLEIKNIATEPEYQGKGYGKVLIDFVAAKYKGGILYD